MECTESQFGFRILRVTSRVRTQAKQNRIEYLTYHSKVSNELNFSLDFGDEAKLFYFQPGESDLAFDWLDFAQFLLNMKFERTNE